MNGISCFAGVGGLDLALREAAGVRTVCYVEIDPYCQEVLQKRMQEGWLHHAPIWGDILTFDGRPWNGKVDCVFGGFPCQDISVAGKGAGIKEGTRSGLWFELLRVVGEVRPQFVFLENVSAITHRGLDTVLAGLAEAGYDALWIDLRASDVGAPHRRERWFCLAYRNDGYNKQDLQVSTRWNTINSRSPTEDLADSCEGIPLGERQPTSGRQGGVANGGIPAGIWSYDPADFPDAVESGVGRVAYGVPKRVDRLKCLGNAVVPQQAAEAWRILYAAYLENTYGSRNPQSGLQQPDLSSESSQGNRTEEAEEVRGEADGRI